MNSIQNKTTYNTKSIKNVVYFYLINIHICMRFVISVMKLLRYTIT